MKKRYLKSSIFFLLALCIIITSAIGIPMLEGYAEGMSGSYNPTIGSTVTSLTGNSLHATAYDSSWGVSSVGYPRLITNGNQISATVLAYDTEGITSLQVRFVKNTSTDPARTWATFGSDVQEIFYQNYSPYTNKDKKTYTFTLTPGRYIFMSAATTTDGRYATNYDYIEYGTGNIIGTDFAMSQRATPTGFQRFCALYDLTGQGINIPGCSLLMTRVGHNPPFNYVSPDLSITRYSPNSKLYLVTGTANISAFSYIHGTYRTWLNVQRSNGNYETINYPDFYW